MLYKSCLCSTPSSLSVQKEKYTESKYPIRTYRYTSLLVPALHIYIYIKTSISLEITRIKNSQVLKVARAMERVATLLAFAFRSWKRLYTEYQTPSNVVKRAIHSRDDCWRGSNYDALRSGGFARNLGRAFEGTRVGSASNESLAFEVARSSHSRGTSVTR